MSRGCCNVRGAADTPRARFARNARADQYTRAGRGGRCEKRVRGGRIESRRAPERPLDVLVQHLVTIALGTGFVEADLLAEVRDTWSYRALSDEDWNWALDFVGRGGEALRAYPDYQRVSRDADGVYHVDNARIGQRHRMSIGTIVSERAVDQTIKDGMSA